MFFYCSGRCVLPFELRKLYISILIIRAMRYLLVVFVVGVFTLGSQAQDLVVRTSGDSLRCEIIEENAERLTIKSSYKGRKVVTGLDQSTVSSVVYGFYDHRPNHALYGFLGGGFTLGGRYDYTAHGSGFAQMSASIGVGGTEDLNVASCLFGNCNEPEKYTAFVHQIAVVLGRGRHLIELGLGGTYYHGDQSNKEYHLAPLVGYRFYPKLNSGFAARLVLMPPILNTDTDIITGPIGVGLGFAF